MTLLDLIPVWAALTASALTAVCLWGAIRLRVLYSLWDPSSAALFQVTFTFWVLILIRLLPVGDVIGFVLFFVILAAGRDKKGKRGKPLITDEEWIRFSYVLISLLFVLNIYLIKQKGFLLLSNDLGIARVDFYQNWGIFKRLNESGVGVIGISGFFLWSRGKKKLATLYFLFTAFLMLSLGSRASLLVFLFLYGAYARYVVQRVRTAVLVLVGLVLGLSSLSLFYLMYGTQFLLMFGERVVAYCDGPVYFFFGNLPGRLFYGPGYALDQVLIDLRLREHPAYLSLGQLLDWNFLRYDNPLTGPNPQFCVEAHVMFGWAFLIWYAFVAFAFVYLRKKMSTPFSFYAVSMIVGPLLMDSQFAGSQVFSASLVLGLVFLVRYLRRILVLATESVRAMRSMVAE